MEIGRATKDGFSTSGLSHLDECPVCMSPHKNHVLSPSASQYLICERHGFQQMAMRWQSTYTRLVPTFYACWFWFMFTSVLTVVLPPMAVIFFNVSAFSDWQRLLSKIFHSASLDIHTPNQQVYDEKEIKAFFIPFDYSFFLRNFLLYFSGTPYQKCYSPSGNVF